MVSKRRTFGTPCAGAKKLDVLAKCVPATTVGGRVANGASASVTCPADTYIANIDFASYGTPQGSFPDFSIDQSCFDPATTSIVSAACVGHASCDIDTASRYFHNLRAR